MSLIPSKRFDRILPALPPLCLLLPALLARVPATRFPQRMVFRTVLGSIACAAVLSSVYAISKVGWAYSHRQSALRDLGCRTLELASGISSEIGVVRGGDEGLLLYTHQTRFLSEDAAQKEWAVGALRFLILPEKSKNTLLPKLANARVLEETGRIDGKASAYLLLEKNSP